MTGQFETDFEFKSCQPKKEKSPRIKIIRKIFVASKNPSYLI